VWCLRKLRMLPDNAPGPVITCRQECMLWLPSLRQLQYQPGAAAEL
jgi:hypothetical protein